MKKSLRSVQKAAKPKSAKERWTGARMAGPVAGMCSRPTTLGRNQAQRAVTNDHALQAVQRRAARVDLEGLVPPRRLGAGGTPARLAARRVTIPLGSQPRQHLLDDILHGAPGGIEPVGVLGLPQG